MVTRLRAGRRWILRVDGLVSLVFGVSTILAQHAIFDSAVDLASANVTGDGTTVMESALFALSGYYVLVGVIALALSDIPDQFQGRLALLLAVHHACMASKGAAESGHIWVVGSPWLNVAIHTAFSLVYMVLLLMSRKQVLNRWRINPSQIDRRTK